MYKGRICPLCRPNTIILGLTQKDICYGLQAPTPNYSFIYSLNNGVIYKYSKSREPSAQHHSDDIPMISNITEPTTGKETNSSTTTTTATTNNSSSCNFSAARESNSNKHFGGSNIALPGLLNTLLLIQLF